MALKQRVTSSRATCNAWCVALFCPRCQGAESRCLELQSVLMSRLTPRPWEKRVCRVGGGGGMLPSAHPLAVAAAASSYWRI